MSQETGRERRLPGGLPLTLGSGRVRLGAVLAIAIAGGLLGWLLTRGGGDQAAQPSTTAFRPGQVIPGLPAGAHVGPTIISPTALASMKRALHQPVYWLGEQHGVSYELDATAGGNVYLTYLPKGVKSSGDRTRYLGVGTYPVRNAADGLRTVAQKTDGQITKRDDGAIVYTTARHPGSAYVAYPNADFEIEIYAPKPKKARELALSQKLQAVG